ncbi:hypothetical protein PHSY_004579 [Pseudozyma hubeiensis SY62]|uniref:Uncharacterized protein n=1 Tax=Pseudozyma hubeiensis (strain SY62) TaxID=1305764 RepID=R9PFX5_PSEHS|nr:hypothetical protein PHSY_004579 [Pseudozyma hubeiensis SY62]GAC96995.1 hypothetical protein PHSY_004579 [Pseudozyma hubeiensis SY62]
MDGSSLSRIQTWIKDQGWLVFLSSVQRQRSALCHRLTCRVGLADVPLWNRLVMERFLRTGILRLHSVAFPVGSPICQQHTLLKSGRCQMMSKLDR